MPVANLTRGTVRKLLLLAQQRQLIKDFLMTRTGESVVLYYGEGQQITLPTWRDTMAFVARIQK